MKYLLTICLFPLEVFSQSAIRISFDDTNNLDLITIDTVSNPNNIWQIGKPQKSNFTSSTTQPNAIVTDTINPYSVNDTSTFYLWFPKLNSSWEWPELNFVYMVDMDSVNDFGEIQYSRDKGITWQIIDDGQFKGHSSNWQGFTFGASWGNSDSLLFKFTIYSDSVSEGRDGWIIDDIYMFDFPQSVYENNKETKVKITPNPAQETIRIQFLDPNIRDSQELKIYSITGQLVLHQMIYPPESEINIETLESGVYMYVIGDYRGKMVVE
ncbi:T9SS type A sorting domain-containing protein [bacterium SCSIO 12643]|nr:T9SS type A sorting domain-containing protein [bacterium SCSIO 12643]